MSLELKPFDYKSGLRDQRALFLECFPENTGTPVVTDKYYIWKFQSSSEVPPSFEYCARLDDELVGYYAALTYPYNYFGKQVYVGMVCDVMTGIKARGKGVFTSLGNFSLDNMRDSGKLEFVTGYPIRKEVIPGHKKAGWDFPFIIPMYGKFLKMDSFMESRKIAALRYVLNPFLTVYNLIFKFIHRPHPSVKVEIYDSKNIEAIPGLDNLLTDLQKQTSISLRKDLNFLKWRLGAPDRNYFIFILRKGSEILGYSAGRCVVKEEVPCFGILDFSLLKRYERYSSVLLREIERKAKTLKAELILLMILKRFAFRYGLIRNGWIRTPFKFSFILRKTGNEAEIDKLSDENNWFLTWLDSDDL